MVVAAAASPEPEGPVHSLAACTPVAATHPLALFLCLFCYASSCNAPVLLLCASPTRSPPLSRRRCVTCSDAVPADCCVWHATAASQPCPGPPKFLFLYYWQPATWQPATHDLPVTAPGDQLYRGKTMGAYSSMGRACVIHLSAIGVGRCRHRCCCHQLHPLTAAAQLPGVARWWCVATTPTSQLLPHRCHPPAAAAQRPCSRLRQS